MFPLVLLKGKWVEVDRAFDQEIHGVTRALATLSQLRSGGHLSQECFSRRNGLLLERRQQLAQELAPLAGQIATLKNRPSASARATDSPLAGQRPWGRHNLQRLFCAWWGLAGFADSPEPLQRLTREFRQGRRAAGSHPFCSFSKLLEKPEALQIRRSHGN